MHISIEDYYHNGKDNKRINIYDNHKQIVLWFSFKTIVAFHVSDGHDNKLVISENIYSSTTGRHLNAINSDHKIRLPRKEFEQKLNAVLERIKIV